MRILAVTHSYPRRPGDVAGSFLERLFRALAARGHTVRVLAPSDGGQGGRDEAPGLTVERIRYAAPAHETLAYRGTMLAAARRPAGLRAFRGLVRAFTEAVLARAGDADVVHANWWIPAGLAAARARRRGAPPYVVTLHGTDAQLLRRFPPARWLARGVLRQAAGVTAVSDYLGQAARLAGARAVTVQPMPVEVARFDRGSRGGGGLVTVGRLTAQKRIHLLLEAAARLARLGRPTPVTIIGDGPERPALETRALRLGIAARVRFTGAVPPDGVAATVGDADVFVFPAFGEGFGLAAAEAVMLGVPVVALTDGGGVADVVREGAGLLAPPDDPDALAAAVARLLDDPCARPRAAAAAAELRERLAPERVAAEFERVLRQAVGGDG